jgi:hypothetical protein
MIPALKTFWNDLLNDPAFFARLTRSLLLGFAASSAGLGAMLPDGKLRIGVFIAGGIAGVLGGLIAAGQMNAPPPPAP